MIKERDWRHGRHALAKRSIARKRKVVLKPQIYTEISVSVGVPIEDLELLGAYNATRERI